MVKKTNKIWVQPRLDWRAIITESSSSFSKVKALIEDISGLLSVYVRESPAGSHLQAG